MPNTKLERLRVAVTGGTSGLGLALVRLLVARGSSPVPPEPLSARPVRRRRAALSATLDARRTFTRSRCKLRAISAGLMLSSTTHRALDLLHSHPLPTLNARNWRGHSQ